MAHTKVNLKTLNARPQSDKQIEKIWHETIPTSTRLPRVDKTPINFHIPSRENQWIDMSNIQLRLKMRVVRRNNAGAWVALTDNDLVVPLNNFLHTIIESASLDLNER
jgi:hypothetical protein